MGSADQRVGWQRATTVRVALASVSLVILSGPWSIRAGGTGRPPSAETSTATRQALGPQIANAVAAALQSHMDPLSGAQIPLAWQAPVAALYEGPLVPELLWIDDDGRPNANARAALKMIGQADADGLDPAAYRSTELEGLAREGDGVVDAERVQRAVAMEIGLSIGTLRYLWHLRHGRVEASDLSFRLPRTRPSSEVAAALRRACKEDDVRSLVAAWSPPFVLYRSLREVLARYRAIAGNVAFTESLPDRLVSPGETYDALGRLQARLIALDDLSPDTPPVDGAYEGPLVDAVRRYQARHGLVADGVIGAQTLSELQVPIAWRVRQIELALERLRWLPPLDASPLVAVNIPMFRLWAWDTVPSEGKASLGMDVIVGRAFDARTPVFVEEMREVIFRPYWNVPDSIVRSEILPALSRDASYLDANQMEIVDGPGDFASVMPTTPETVAALARGRLRLRQQPGPANALGLVKFVFPNGENVYLHDTPVGDLFRRPRRDFSHGCVRVAEPALLAEWVLRGEGGWGASQIAAAMSGERTVRVELTHPVRVVLFYLTVAVMPEDGRAHFAQDVYGYDRALDRALSDPNATF